MSVRRVIRQVVLSLAASVGLLVWPSLSRAATIAQAGVITWDSSSTTLFIATSQYPTAAAWDAGAGAARMFCPARSNPPV